MSSNANLDRIRHSAAHVMAAAVCRVFENVKLDIGPATDTGFYYDFDIPVRVTPEDFEKIEAEMKAIIAEKLPFERREMSRLRLQNNTASPFTRYIQVAHRERDDDGADRKGSQNKSAVSAINNNGLAKNARDLIGDLREGEADELKNDETDDEGDRFAGAFELASEQTHDNCAEYREPQNE